MLVSLLRECLYLVPVRLVRLLFIFSVMIDLIESGEPQGFCLACAEVLDGIEPDARGHECYECGKFKAYGAEELLLNGLYFDADREADMQHARAQGYIK